MKTFIVKSCTAILLIIAIMLATVSCAVEGTINCITESSADVESVVNVNAEGDSSDPLAPTDKEATVSQMKEERNDEVKGEDSTPQTNTSVNGNDYFLSGDELKDEVTDETTESKEDVTDETTELTVETKDEAADEITVPNEKEAEVLDVIIKENHLDRLSATTEWSSDEQETFNLALDCIAYDLYAAGFDVFKAYAVIGDKTALGLAFTKNQVYTETEDGKPIYSCGFVQLIKKNDGVEIAITSQDAENGTAIIPYGEYDTEEAFVLTLNMSMSGYSGINGNLYFKYAQISDYAVEVTICDDDRSVYDESIDLYNFNKERFVFKADLTYSSVDASPYFSDEAKAYQAAQEAIDKIIAEQEKNAFEGRQEVIIVFTEDAINEYLTNNQNGTVNGFLLEEIGKIEVADNEFLVITPDGIQKEPIVDRDAIAEGRIVNGILGIIGGALMLAGSIFVAVITFGAGTPIAVGTIAAVSCAGTLIYAGSQIAEATQNLIFGIKGDIETEAVNPMLEVFKKMIPDEEKAAKIYHIAGLSCSIAQALIVPANAAISLSNAAKAAGVKVTVWQTALAVTRAVAVEAVKIAITGFVSVGVGQITNVVVTEITDSESWGKIAGFAGAIVAGAFTYKGLNRLDKKYNFSGLEKIHLKNYKTEQTKEELVSEFSENKWTDMSDYEKKMVIERLANSVADDLGLKSKPRIRYYNKEGGGYGYFDDTNKTININEHYFNKGVAPGREVLDTVCHELRHQFQFENLGFDDVSWSYEHYISYDPKLGNYDAYANQPCEVDSQNYAKLWTAILEGLIK